MSDSEPAGSEVEDIRPTLGVDQASQAIRDVGKHVRRLRSSRKMTLQELAEETGVSTSMLSMLERGMATPSIGTLVAVSSALGIPMVDLFAPINPERESPVRRLAEQLTVEAAEGVLRRLVLNDKSHGVELVVNEYQPGTESANTPVHHAGTEFGVLLSGTLCIEIDGEAHLLKKGDAITYSSRDPHRISNPGRAVARAVWLNLGVSR